MMHAQKHVAHLDGINIRLRRKARVFDECESLLPECQKIFQSPTLRLHRQFALQREEEWLGRKDSKSCHSQ